MISPNYRCYVYFNIGNGPYRGTWSVKQRGKVVAHVRRICLRDCRLLVGPSGRAKVLREGRKHVHAGVSGYLDEGCGEFHNWSAVTYNPYKYDSFVCRADESPIRVADYVDLDVDCPEKVVAFWSKKL
jgi:hypothetical protein